MLGHPDVGVTVELQQTPPVTGGIGPKPELAVAADSAQGRAGPEEFLTARAAVAQLDWSPVQARDQAPSPVMQFPPAGHRPGHTITRGRCCSWLCGDLTAPSSPSLVGQIRSAAAVLRAIDVAHQVPSAERPQQI